MRRQLYDQSDVHGRPLMVFSARVVGMSGESVQVQKDVVILAEGLTEMLRAGPALVGLGEIHSVCVVQVIEVIRRERLFYSVDYVADGNSKTAILWCTPQSVLQPLPSGPPCGLPAVPGAEAACSAPVVALLAFPPFCRLAVAAASLALPSSLAPVSSTATTCSWELPDLFSVCGIFS